MAELLAAVERSALRAQKLTQQLLTFAKGGAPIKSTTSIATLVTDSATFALRGSKVGHDFQFPNHLWAVEVDEGQISQVIGNLVIKEPRQIFRRHPYTLIFNRHLDITPI